MVNRCPLCGTSGRLWNKKPQVFKCPNCMTIFSEFGLVIERDFESLNPWS